MLLLPFCTSLNARMCKKHTTAQRRSASPLCVCVCVCLLRSCPTRSCSIKVSDDVVDTGIPTPAKTPSTTPAPAPTPEPTPAPAPAPAPTAGAAQRTAVGPLLAAAATMALLVLA